MKKNKKVFVFVFETKNESATIFQSQANDEKTFTFVTVKKINNSMKKQKINKIHLFFENFLFEFYNFRQKNFFLFLCFANA